MWVLGLSPKSKLLAKETSKTCWRLAGSGLLTILTRLFKALKAVSALLPDTSNTAPWMMLWTSYKSCKVLPTTLFALAIKLIAEALTLSPANTLVRVLSLLRSKAAEEEVATATS